MADAVRDTFLRVQGLGEPDLAANRAGRLSDVQADRLRAEIARKSNVITGGIVFGAAGTCAAVATAASDWQGLAVAIPAIITIDLLILVSLRKLVFGRWMERIDARAVEAVTGEVTALGGAGRHGFRVRIGARNLYGHGFDAVGRRLARGQHVTAYALARSHHLVAIEPPG